MNKGFNKWFKCLTCGLEYPMGKMAYRWYYRDGPKGICEGCNRDYLKKGVSDVNKLLDTKFKGFPEDHNLYFRVWSYMWSREVIEGWWGERYSSLNHDEPDINYALCLIWEDKLYFRNYGAELDILLRSKEGEIRRELLKKQKELLGLYDLYKIIR